MTFKANQSRPLGKPISASHPLTEQTRLASLTPK